MMTVSHMLVPPLCNTFAARISLLLGLVMTGFEGNLHLINYLNYKDKRLIIHLMLN